MSLWVIKKRRMHLDPLLGCRGRPRHWTQTARELSGSPVPQNSQHTPRGAILQLLPPFPEGCGDGLGLRPRHSRRGADFTQVQGDWRAV
jgi:hypothetical protein